jgi:hypothetical protein
MLDKMDNEAARDQLIETLRTVTAGKVNPITIFAKKNRIRNYRFIYL